MQLKMDDDIRAFLGERCPFMTGPKRNQYPAVSLRNSEIKAFPKANAKSALLYKLFTCPLAGLIVDHINRDTTDLRRENLRLVKYSQNAWNAGKRADNGLPKGVHLHGSRYRAKIVVGRKPHFLGMFDTPGEAAKAYNAAAKDLFGGYASLNPEG